MLRQELADRLGQSLSNILTREEVVSVWGSELNYTNEKSLSNAGNLAPCFYLAPLFGEEQAKLGKGLALYSSQELKLWVHDPSYRRAMERLEKAGRPHPWPAPLAAGVVATPQSGSDAEEFLDKLSDDQDYKDRILGRKKWDE